MKSEQEIRDKISELEQQRKRKYEAYQNGKVAQETMEIFVLEYNSKMLALEWVLDEE